MKKHLLLLSAGVLMVFPAFAQEVDVQVEEQPVAIDIQKIDIAPVEPFPEGYRSLFFTPDEHAGIVAALARKMPVAFVAEPSADAQAPVTPGTAASPRILHLSGIVYAKEGEWSIWLNGRQITPTAGLPEIRGLKVERDSISLQWFDAQTQTVVPVRLRPQQRFNIDTKSFMPGTLDAPMPVADPSSSALMP